MEGHAGDWRGRWGQVTEGLECWAQQLGCFPRQQGAIEEFSVKERHVCFISVC